MGSILVHIDLDGGQPHPSSLAALAAGRALASSWGATLYAALIVHEPGDRSAADSTAKVMTSARVTGIESIRSTLARGADKILVAVTDTPVLPLWAAIGGAWQTVTDHLRPRLVLFGADAPAANELGPRTSARLGGRFLVRARRTGGEVIELRDRDGAYVRIGDSGAAIVLVSGCASERDACDEDVDLVVLAAPSGGDARLELTGTTPAEPTRALRAVVALGDEAAEDPAVVADAARLATLLGAPVLRSSGNARADKHANSSAELFVSIGVTTFEPSGASSVIRIGGVPGRNIDGALAEPVAPALADLVRAVEERS